MSQYSKKKSKINKNTANSFLDSINTIKIRVLKHTEDIAKKIKPVINSRVFTLLSVIAVILLSSFILYSRYKPNFTHPNFYGEDGPVYTAMLQEKGYLGAMLTPFNGYLITGLYLVMYLGTFLNFIFGEGLFSHLPFHYALASCLFMGLTVSLPYILFRKELGILASLAIVLLSAFVPLEMRDYAVIGTIGNLKFAFLYIAFLMVIYRAIHYKDRWKCFIVDAVLLLSVLSNGGAVLLIPFAYIPYLRDYVKKKSIIENIKLLLKSHAFISLLIVTFISALYAVLVQVKGVMIPEYLNQPWDQEATLSLINRVSVFALTYPITGTMNDKISLGLLLLALVVLFRKKDWFVWVLGIWAITSSVLLFVTNRPGISIYYLNYLHLGGTDEFFYYANFIFYFLVFWRFRDSIKRLSLIGASIFIFSIGLYVVWAQPFGMTSEKIKPGYPEIGTLMQNLERECKSDNDPVNLNIYPTSDWHMPVDREVACSDPQHKQ